MKVAVVGAGFSGITTAKTLIDHGHDVTVFERCADVGGVWSKERRYVSLATQNTKDTYCLSDLPMPKHYPIWPESAQVQAYLEAYVEKNKLAPHIKLNTNVNDVTPSTISGKAWHIKAGDGTFEDDYDHLTVANGIFCEGAIPDFNGADEFTKAGGRICHTSTIRDIDQVKGRHVVVVGFGKSACDVANALAVPGGATSTTVVVRNLVWKLPRRIRGLNYKFLLLTRFGEALFQYIKPSSAIERFFHRSVVGRAIRNGIVGLLQWVIQGQLGLKEVGLIPEGSFDRIARSTISLSTEGFFSKVAAGDIKVLRNTEIARLHLNDKTKSATLTNGQTIPVDVIVCGTGFEQRPPTFLPKDVLEGLTDERGNWLLFRHILPLQTKNLTFNGYNSSLFCPTSSEAAALWIVAYLARGDGMLPSQEERRRQTVEKLAWLDARSEGKHAHGTNLVPFSLHSIDDTLRDIGVNLTWPQRLYQWLMPVDPTAYRGLSAQLAAKLKIA